jgi:hypothetical protein
MEIIAHLPAALQGKTCNNLDSTRSDCIAPAKKAGAKRTSEKTYPIEKKPVIACAIIRRRGEIYTRPCIFEGVPAHILQHEVILGIVPASPGIYAVEYLSEVRDDPRDDDDDPIELGYEYPNQVETPDWQARAAEIEKTRLSFSRLSAAQKAEIVRATE